MIRFLLLSKLSLRNVLRNKRRTLISLATVTAGVMSAIILSALARGISYGMADEVISRMTGEIQIQIPQYVDDPAAEYSFETSSDLLEQIKNYSWTERLRLPGMIMSERKSLGVTLVGINLDTEKNLSFIGRVPIIGSKSQELKNGEILIGKKLAEKLNTQLGRRLVVLGTDSSQQTVDRGYEIAGIYDAELESTELNYVFLSINNLQELFKLPNKISEIIIKNSQQDLSQTVQILRTNLRKDLSITTWRDRETFVVALQKLQNGILILWYFIVVVTICFGIINSMFMSIFERTHEIGLLQAIGMRKNQVLIELQLESLFIVFTGIILGNLFSLVILEMLSQGIDLSYFSSAIEYLGARKIIYPKLLLSDAVVSNLMILIVAGIACLYPAYKGAQLEPKEAMLDG